MPKMTIRNIIEKNMVFSDHDRDYLKMIYFDKIDREVQALIKAEKLEMIEKIKKVVCLTEDEKRIDEIKAKIEKGEA